MQMQIDETRQGIAAATVYSPITGLALNLRLRPQALDPAILQDKRLPADEFVFLPNAAVFDQDSRHVESIRLMPSFRTALASIAPIIPCAATGSFGSF